MWSILYLQISVIDNFHCASWNTTDNSWCNSVFRNWEIIASANDNFIVIYNMENLNIQEAPKQRRIFSDNKLLPKRKNKSKIHLFQIKHLPKNDSWKD